MTKSFATEPQYFREFLSDVPEEELVLSCAVAGSVCAVAGSVPPQSRATLSIAVEIFLMPFRTIMVRLQFQTTKISLNIGELLLKTW